MRVNRKEFHAALVRAAKVVELKSPMLRLRSVGLRFDDGGVTVTATDLRRWGSWFVSGTGGGSASRCAVALKILTGLVQPIGKSEAGQEIDLEVVNGDTTKLSVTVGGDVSTIQCFPDELDIPEGVAQAVGVGVTYQANMLSSALEYVMQACSEEARLNVINFDGKFLTATDGHRLHREVLAPVSNELFFSFSVPSNCVATLQDICERGDEIMLEHFTIPGESGGLWLRTGCEHVKFYARLPDVQVPDYDRVIPVFPEDAGYQRITLEASFLERALGRMCKISPRRPCQPLLKMSAAGAWFSLVVREEDIDLEMVVPNSDLQFHPKSGAEVVAIGFNAGYMLDAIDGVKGLVTWTFEDNCSPIRVDISANRLAIVMPFRL